MSDAPLVWGLDISKRRTGLAHGRAGERPSVVSVSSTEGDDAARAGTRLFVYLRDLMRVARPDAIFYERMLEHGFGAEVDWETQTVKQRKGVIAAFDIARMTHTVEIFAGLASIACHNVAPSTVRKEFLGDGRLGRKDAKRRALAMSRVLGWPAENDDEADALGVWHYGVCRASVRLATPIHAGLHAKAATMAAGNMPRVRGDDQVPW